MTDYIPQTIPELWYRLDKRLALIEQYQHDHYEDHATLEKILADHEARIRSTSTASGIISGGSSILALIAIIKAFFIAGPSQ
jgi:hypothetical protein